MPAKEATVTEPRGNSLHPLVLFSVTLLNLAFVAALPETVLIMVL
jgi:hypothetical protein